MNFDEINSTEKYGKWRELTIQYMQMLGYTTKEKSDRSHVVL